MIQNGCRWRGRRTWICRVEWERNCLRPSMRLLWKWSAHFGADGELTRSGGRWVRQTVDVLCFSALFLSSAWESWEECDECWLTASGADDERLIRLRWPPAGFLPLMCPGHLCGVRAQTTGELIHSRFTQINNVPPALFELLNAAYVAPPGKDSPQHQAVPWPPSVPSCLLEVLIIHLVFVWHRRRTLVSRSTQSSLGLHPLSKQPSELSQASSISVVKYGSYGTFNMYLYVALDETII